MDNVEFSLSKEEYETLIKFLYFAGHRIYRFRITPAMEAGITDCKLIDRMTK